MRFLLYLALASCPGDVERKPTPAPVPVAQPRAPLALIPLVTPADDPQLFIELWFFPLTDRIIQTYPVESVRVEVARFMSRTQTDEIKLMLGDDLADPRVAAMTGIVEGGPAVAFSVPNLMFYARGCQWQVPCLEDNLAQAYIHEQYHVDHHVRGYLTTEPDPATIRQHESEAWWYAAENALAPMANNGRLARIQHGGPLERALDAYFASNHDPTSPAWQSFVDWVTGE